MWVKFPHRFQNMANLTFTRYAFIGTKKQCKDLFAKLTGLKEEKLTWCGNLIETFGGNPNNISCRGSFLDFRMNGNKRIDIDLEFAWTESPDFRYFLEKQYKDSKIYYYDYEPGCDVCDTNDDCNIFDIAYIVDSEDKGEEWYDNLQDVAQYVSEIVGYDVEATEDAIENAIEKWQNENDDKFLYLHRFNYVDD